MTPGGMERVNIREFRRLLQLALESNTPLMVWGPPGCGKTQIAVEEIRAHGLVPEVLLAAQCDPTDLGGVPAVAPDADGAWRMKRHALGQVDRASRVPSGLFLDEITNAPGTVQATIQRGVHEGWWGDVRLHPDSRIVLAGNPPHMVAGGGTGFSAPMSGRVLQIELAPEIAEVQAYLAGLGNDGSTLRALALDFAGTLERSTDLVQFDPPKGAIATGRPWGAPRSWERALRFMASAMDAGEDEQGRIVNVGLLGCVGEVAASWQAIRRVRTSLPGISEILTNPSTAGLPRGADGEAAILGVLAQVGVKDPAALWVYVKRLKDEIRVVAYRLAWKFPIDPRSKSPHLAQAEKARMVLVAAMSRLVAGV